MVIEIVVAIAGTIGIKVSLSQIKKLRRGNLYSLQDVIHNMIHAQKGLRHGIMLVVSMIALIVSIGLLLSNI